VATLLELIRLKRNDWVVTSFILLLLIGLFFVLLIRVLLVVLASLLTLKTLLHSDHDLLTQWLWWVLNQELLTFLSIEVVWDEILSHLHLVQHIELVVNVLLNLLSIDDLLLSACDRQWGSFRLVERGLLLLLSADLQTALAVIERFKVRLTELLY